MATPIPGRPTAPVRRRPPIRPKIVVEEDVLAQPGYASRLKHGPNRRELVIVLSTSATFPMQRRPFASDVLYVADKQVRYYLTDAWRLAKSIVALMARNGYEKVLFLGGSKGGFGALMLAGLCARQRPDFFFRVLAFSPQVGLYPINRELYYPSYHKLCMLAIKDGKLFRYLSKFGDISYINHLRNIHVTLVYPSGNLLDEKEASLLEGPHIRKYPIHTSVHNTFIFVTFNTLDEAVVKDRIAKVYDNTEDEDVAATRPQDVSRIVSEIVDATWLPTFDALVAEVMAVRPLARMRGKFPPPRPTSDPGGGGGPSADEIRRVLQPYEDLVAAQHVMAAVLAEQEGGPLLTTARRHMAQGDTPSALAVGVLASHMEPRSIGHLLLCAEALAKLGAVERAAGFLSRAEALGPGPAPQAHINRIRRTASWGGARGGASRLSEPEVARVTATYADLLSESDVEAAMSSVRRGGDAPLAVAERHLREGRASAALAVSLLSAHLKPKSFRHATLCAEALIALGAGRRAEAFVSRADHLADSPAKTRRVRELARRARGGLVGRLRAAIRFRN